MDGCGGVGWRWIGIVCIIVWDVNEYLLHNHYVDRIIPSTIHGHSIFGKEIQNISMLGLLNKWYFINQMQFGPVVKSPNVTQFTPIK